MHKVQKMASGSLKCGPDLYARRVEGGYECWRAVGPKYSRQWEIGQITPFKDGAIAWLEEWDKAIRGEL